MGKIKVMNRGLLLAHGKSKWNVMREYRIMSRIESQRLMEIME